MRESDFAMTGTTLTTSDNFFRTTMSIGLSLRVAKAREAASQFDLNPALQGWCRSNVLKMRERIDVRMSRWLDKKEAAMDPGVLDVALPLGCKLLPEIGGMLVLDIFDNGIPAEIPIVSLGNPSSRYR